MINNNKLANIKLSINDKNDVYCVMCDYRIYKGRRFFIVTDDKINVLCYNCFRKNFSYFKDKTFIDNGYKSTSLSDDEIKKLFKELNKK